MPSTIRSGLKRLCAALPKTAHDEQFESLSRLQQLLVLVAASAVALTVPPLLVDGGRATVGVALGIGTLFGVTSLLSRYNRRWRD